MNIEEVKEMVKPPVGKESTREKQSRFCLMVSYLIQYAFEQGYELTLGQALRTQAEADANAASGSGISASLHCEKLAIDLNLFLGGMYLTSSTEHEPLGIFWESIGGTWGGRFSKPDGNHYSLEHNGYK
jgi:hypothetical protein